MLSRVGLVPNTLFLRRAVGTASTPSWRSQLHSTTFFSPLKPMHQQVRHSSSASDNDHEIRKEDIDDLYSRLPSVYSLSDRKKMNVIPYLINRGIPLLQESHWLVPKRAAHDTLEVIARNKMTILGIHSFTVAGKHKKVNVNFAHCQDMESIINTHDGNPEELVGKCVSAASDFLFTLEKKKVKDVDYVSFITTENWSGETEEDDDSHVTFSVGTQ